jgi:hypothetical protein
MLLILTSINMLMASIVTLSWEMVGSKLVWDSKTCREFFLNCSTWQNNQNHAILCKTTQDMKR